MVPISEEVVRSTASICGAHSGAAQAIRKAEASRAAGLEVEFFSTRGGIIVASRAPEPAA